MPYARVRGKVDFWHLGGGGGGSLPPPDGWPCTKNFQTDLHTLAVLGPVKPVKSVLLGLRIFKNFKSTF